MGRFRVLMLVAAAGPGRWPFEKPRASKADQFQSLALGPLGQAALPIHIAKLPCHHEKDGGNGEQQKLSGADIEFADLEEHAFGHTFDL